MITSDAIEITAILGVAVSIILLIWLLIENDKSRIKKRAIESELEDAHNTIAALEHLLSEYEKKGNNIESLKKQVTHLNTLGIKRESEIRRLKGELKKHKNNDNKKQ